MTKSIGIDLGTTYSLVASVNEGTAQILKDNADGRIPSALLYPNGMKQLTVLRIPLVGRP